MVVLKSPDGERDRDVTRAQLDVFLKRASEIGLERVKGDKSTFPLDFQMTYNGQYLLNFEYSEFGGYSAGGGLEFYIIGVIKNGKQVLLKPSGYWKKIDDVSSEFVITSREEEKFSDIFAEITKKIEHVFSEIEMIDV